MNALLDYRWPYAHGRISCNVFTSATITLAHWPLRLMPDHDRHNIILLARFAEVQDEARNSSTAAGAGW
jgi:hypothetical protein